MNDHLFFIGIAGHAMRGLALAAKNQGHRVSGIDEHAVPPGSDWLDEQGLEWYREAKPELLDGVSMVIVSGATPNNFSLLVEARRRDIPVMSFAEYLGHITQGRHVISVAGTHGKTTTTSLITWLLESSGRQPDFLIGIQPFNFAASARLEGSATVVVEGDEYKASHWDNRSKVQYYHPNVLVLTNAEHDHPDVFPDEASIIRRFEEIVAALPEDGRLVAWGESSAVRKIATKAACEVTLYGYDTGDYRVRDVAFLPTGIEFDVEGAHGIETRLAAPLYGRHNVLNVLAAALVARGEDLSWDTILEGLSGFKGAYRRFNLLTEPDAPVTVIDDYAHHPTEVATTIDAVRLHFKHRRLIVVFRPHTYSRTQALLKEYHQAFDDADTVFITDIEGARENSDEIKVSGEDIADGLGDKAHYVTDRRELEEVICREAQPGDVILSMTVSGYERLANELASRLSKKFS